jgi:Fe-S oxidoreductase
MIAAMRADLFDEVLGVDTVWMCVSCHACAEVCPAKIPVAGGLMARAKEELLLAGNVPTELQEALEASQRYGNPLGESTRKRAGWIEDLEVTVLDKAGGQVDVLWFVGDYASYHPRVTKASRALVSVLGALGVDFGILGPAESSDGDSQRLAGERGLFEMLAERNGKALAKHEFSEIITTDPHAFNAIKNEYPALGIEYPVRHYTQFLADHIDEVRQRCTTPIDGSVPFHDPCFLGRVNDVYEEPRSVLRSIPGLEVVEMTHNRENALCCGGGGGGMWMDGFHWEKAELRLSDLRVREAVDAGADILAVACPYETPRFEDATKTVVGAERLRVRDLAELLAESMGVMT